MRLPEPKAPVLALRNLSRTFPGSPDVHALKNVNLDIMKGQYVSIAGPSGSGKSTLLHLIGLLDSPTSGSYRLDGIETTTLSDLERTALRGLRIGFVFQSFHLLNHRTVFDNVQIAQLYNRTSRSVRASRALNVLAAVGLDHRVNFYPNTLSGGEQQRVAIARALVSHPAVLLADEPTGNLDSDTSAAMLDLFDDLHDDGLSVVVITHDEAVARRAERQVYIADGEVVEVR